MITANQAKKLMPVDIKNQVYDLSKHIEKAARKGRSKLKVGAWEYKDNKQLWINGGYDKSKEWKEAKKILEELGFIVTFHYDCGGMAVDMYTIVGWEN
jgi:hypothetical protein